MTTAANPPDPRPGAAVRFEQAVYGSFPFWDRGYAVLAASPGCRPEWLAEFRLACQNLGERPAGLADAPGLFALRLPCGVWAVAGVRPQGLDDRGRPGALAFHGLFLTPGEYRRAGNDPFALAGALRSDWSAATTTLGPGAWAVGPVREPVAPADPRAGRVAEALIRRRRVALEAPGPIDDLARAVWRALPVKARARASVATWAFANGNRFDLLAVPRLKGVALDPSYLDLAADPQPDRPVARRGAGVSPAALAPAALPALMVVVLFLVLAGSLAARRRRGDEPAAVASPVARRSHPPGSESGLVGSDLTPPPARPVGAADDDPGERRRTAEALTALAERFGVAPGGDAGDPPALMARLAGSLRYRGPWLDGDSRADLARQAGYDAALALRWDALARRFAADRPLPADFASGPLRWQVGVLAWSFHLDPGPGPPPPNRRPADEAAHALAEALTVDSALGPSPLAARYPALDSYRKFLDRLPRR